MARSNFIIKKIKSVDKYQVIKELIKSIYHKHKGRYGYRRITDELNNQGMVINHKTVLRLMIIRIKVSLD
jgi:transposase InsO family protein